MGVFDKFKGKNKEEVYEADDTGNLFTLHLNAKLQPLDRGEIYEDIIDEVLETLGLGYVDGGGTLMSKTGEFESCDVDIILNDNSESSINQLLELINDIGVPKGSMLISEDNIEMQLGSLEGFALYLNGSDLPSEVYVSCDINFVISELERLLDNIGILYSYWEGPSETALYFYGDSFEEMTIKISSFIKEYPLCQKCRLVQIA